MRPGTGPESRKLLCYTLMLPLLASNSRVTQMLKREKGLGKRKKRILRFRDNTREIVTESWRKGLEHMGKGVPWIRSWRQHGKGERGPQGKERV